MQAARPESAFKLLLLGENVLSANQRIVVAFCLDAGRASGHIQRPVRALSFEASGLQQFG